MEFQCRVIVQPRYTSCCSSVENIPLQAERHSARRQELFAFPPESAFTFRPECCSELHRNRVRLQSGIAFTFDRIPQLCAALVEQHNGDRAAAGDESLRFRTAVGTERQERISETADEDTVAIHWGVDSASASRCRALYLARVPLN